MVHADIVTHMKKLTTLEKNVLSQIVVIEPKDYFQMLHLNHAQNTHVQLLIADNVLLTHVH